MTAPLSGRFRTSTSEESRSVASDVNGDHSSNGSDGSGRGEEEDLSDETGETHAFTDDGLKKDNHMVTLARVTLMIVLITATGLTTFFSYSSARNLEMKTFEDSFKGVASKLSPGLIDALYLRLWQARTIASGVTAKVRDKNVPPHLLVYEKVDFAAISEEARLISSAVVVSWNPLIRNITQRVEFENMAAEALAIDEGIIPCYVCGSANYINTDASTLVIIPGYGPSTCGEMETAGLGGWVPPESCSTLQDFVADNCICVEANMGTTSSQSTMSGIVEMDEETGDRTPLSSSAEMPLMPHWTVSGFVPESLPTLVDHMASSHSRVAAQAMIEMGLPMFTKTQTVSRNLKGGHESRSSIILFYPVVVDDNVVGSVSMELYWNDMLSVIPMLSENVDVVMENTHGQNFTFKVDENTEEMVLVGEGDLHDPRFDSYVMSSSYEDFDDTVTASTLTTWELERELNCRYRFHIFPKEEFMDIFVTTDPLHNALIGAAIFGFTSLVFIVYDCLVQRAQRNVVNSAKHTTAIVSSLFPKSVRDRMLKEAADESASKKTGEAPMRMSKMRMQRFLSHGESTTAFNSEPIADLFASATVMFLDLVSFTAWSSEREPSQVFVLLETIYGSFDRIARKLDVFKVETIGDSYVAVCGLPTRREGHAPVMVKFAHRCMAAMSRVTKELEVRLGPSTAELQARVGLHSGPVTAGVMRGEKARFQLFGDTVNTASRLESSGQPGRIHASQGTVDLLDATGKGHWASKRDHLVAMKGKGNLQTYFLTYGVDDGKERRSTMAFDIPKSPLPRTTSSKRKPVNRLIDWNTEMLFEFVQRIVLHRNTNAMSIKKIPQNMFYTNQKGKIVIDELTQTLCLPVTAKNTTGSVDKVKIPATVKHQLRAYVKRISEAYRDVPFHCFDHCSHVLMSTSKLMKRILNPDDIDYAQTDDLVADAIHKTTYGISSDPILQFASLFAALIHDVDHTGLTNDELIAENHPLAKQYRDQSVAEQHSVDLAWKILMEPGFSALRKCLYQTEEDLVHFRQLVVNAVMATDIADKELKQAREKRWAETFPVTDSPPESAQPVELESQLERNSKATIVFEYIIQASDVCHTMQHWHTYQKFNKRLFEERYVAWLNGSLEQEPSLGWYGGEIWFFDNYIIPLANKLDKCGVFGVSYHEYLTYAKENRTEWERKGKEIVEEMKSHCERAYAVELQRKLESGVIWA